MPFKIVETIEKGRTQLCIVPNLWEYKGLLKYPKKISENKLARNEKSKPQIDWRCMPCNVKRASLSSYEEAEAELAIMLQNSDTDMGEREEVNDAPSGQLDYNALAESLVLNQHSQPNNAVEVERAVFEILPSSTAAGTFEFEDNNHIEVIGSSVPNNTEIEHILNQILGNQQQNNTEQILNKILENQQKNITEHILNQIMENQENLFKILNTIIDNQKKNSQRLASLSVQSDELYSEFKSSNMQCNNMVKLNEAQDFEREAMKIKPIGNITQLEEFESLLSDKTLRLKLIKQYSILCSESTGKGGTCAYKLLDVLFTREFMCSCSWSGGSRGEAIKVALKGYKNILEFFFRLVHYWDPTFTLDDNESFFKTVLKNSNKRKETMNARASTKRKRSKKESKCQKKIKLVDITQKNQGDKEKYVQMNPENDKENQGLIVNKQSENAAGTSKVDRIENVAGTSNEGRIENVPGTSKEDRVENVASTSKEDKIENVASTSKEDN